MTTTYPWVPTYYYGSEGAADLCNAAQILANGNTFYVIYVMMNDIFVQKYNITAASKNKMVLCFWRKQKYLMSKYLDI